MVGKAYMPAEWMQEVHSNGPMDRVVYGSPTVEQPLVQISFRDVDRFNKQQHRKSCSSN